MKKILIPDKDPLRLCCECAETFNLGLLIKNNVQQTSFLRKVCKKFPELEITYEVVRIPELKTTIGDCIRKKDPSYSNYPQEKIPVVQASPEKINSYVKYCLINLDPDFITCSLPLVIRKKLRHMIEQWQKFVEEFLIEVVQNDSFLNLKPDATDAWRREWETHQEDIIRKFVRDQSKIVRWSLENARRLALAGHTPRAIAVISAKRLRKAFRQTVTNHLRKHNREQTKLARLTPRQFKSLAKKFSAFQQNILFIVSQSEFAPELFKFIRRRNLTLSVLLDALAKCKAAPEKKELFVKSFGMNDSVAKLMLDYMHLSEQFDRVQQRGKEYNRIAQEKSRVKKELISAFQKIPSSNTVFRTGRPV